MTSIEITSRLKRIRLFMVIHGLNLVAMPFFMVKTPPGILTLVFALFWFNAFFGFAYQVFQKRQLTKLMAGPVFPSDLVR